MKQDVYRNRCFLYIGGVREIRIKLPSPACGSGDQSHAEKETLSDT
jgi:hypothetical protein